MKKQRLLCALLASSMAAGMLAGCGGSTQAPAESQSQASSNEAESSPAAAEPQKETEGKTVLKYWYPWGGDSEVWDKWRMAEFEKDQDEIVIEATYVPEGSGISNGKLMAAIQSGDVPDLVVSDQMAASYAFAMQGAFEPLDDALAAIGFDYSKVNPQVIPLMKVGDTTYIYPQNTDTTLLFYRTDLFEEVGLDPNSPPKTIAELDEMADKLVKKNGDDVERYGFIPWLDAGEDGSIWTWQFGADVYDETGNKVTIANDPTAAVFEWMRSYSQKFNPEKMKSFTTSLGAAFSPDHAFMQGKVGITAIGNWFCNALRIYAPDLEYSVAPLPAKDESNYGGTLLAGNVFFCPKGAKEIEAALKFCEYCQSAKVVEDNNKQWRSLGIYKDSIEGLSLYQAGDPYLNICIDVTFNDNSGWWALSPATAELQDKFKGLIDQAIYTTDPIMPMLEDLQNTLQQTVDTTLAQ